MSEKHLFHKYGLFYAALDTLMNRLSVIDYCYCFAISQVNFNIEFAYIGFEVFVIEDDLRLFNMDRFYIFCFTKYFAVA